MIWISKLVMLAISCTQASPETGDSTPAASDPDADLDGVSDAEDCSDDNATISPIAAELCNGIDDDCDGQIDEADDNLADAVSAWPDRDGDGYGDAEFPTALCSVPLGFVDIGGDCDDRNSAINPAALELCDGGTDEDCDGESDESDASDASLWYEDLDGDAWGTDELTVFGCFPGEGWAFSLGDCNDADPLISPSAAESCTDGDENCNGMSGDGDPTIVDQLTFYADLDGDGFGDDALVFLACAAPPGAVAQGGDCDDVRSEVFPGAYEVCALGDEDCDGFEGDDDPDSLDPTVWNVDGDGDGSGSSALTYTSCVAPLGFVGSDGDCDDDEVSVFLGAPELCDGVDQDCDGVADNDAVDAAPWYPDVDGDGEGDPAGELFSCEAPAAYVSGNSDCDDTSASVHPFASETCDDGVDQDCDGVDRPCPLEDSVALGDVGAYWLGESVDDRAGHSVGWLGDSNGNGIDEFCVGAYREDSWDARAGAIYVVESTVTGENSLTTASAKLTGELSGDHAGSSSTGAGDVDGDGYDDLLIGAYLAAPSYSGAAYLVSGPITSMNLSSATAILRGEDPDDEAGNSVAGLGDVDGDGFGDILVGAEGHSEGADGAGAAYVFLGPVSGELNLSAADVRFVGAEENAALGRGVGGGGDVNGDGYADLVIGAPGALNTGAVYVFYGAALSGDVAPEDAQAIITGDLLGDQVGFAARIVGDTDGDGYDDIVAGGPGYSTTETEAGAAWLVRGPPVGDIPSSAADAVLTGESGGDQAGCAVGAGEINGDGRADVLIGAWAEDEVGTTSGAVYLELGPFAGTYSLGDTYAKLVGSGASIETGRSVDARGDIDGDGLGDIIAGAPDLSPYYNGAGGAFLLLASDF